MNSTEWKNRLASGDYDERIAYVYACEKEETDKYKERIIEAVDALEENFGKKEEIRIFSAPGRTEIGGNHTDHQRGAVIAAGINLDVVAAAAKNGTNKVRILSKGYSVDVLNVNELDVNKEEYDKAIALIRGVLRCFADKGYRLEGFDVYTISDVLKGSGMSSSAAFEVVVGTVVNGLFANDEVGAIEIAQMGKYAENVYYNKPSGLMDQMASSVGAVVSIDFKSEQNPIVKKVEFDFTKSGHSLCIIDSGADHADLTDDYAAVTREMRQVASYFGKEVLSEVDTEEFYADLAGVRKAVDNDRAILRAIHFFDDTQRAKAEAKALEDGNFDEFLRIVSESGRSSYMYLQNIYSASAPTKQAMSLALAMCEKILGGRGAFRVHGGGFAGTVQAFVPNDMVAEFKNKIEAVLGEGMCHILSIRPVGGYEF